MSFRDDGAALLSRIAALERQVARVEQLEQRVRELEQENRTLRTAAPAPAQADAEADARPAAGGVEQVYVDAKIHGYVDALLAATRAPAACPGLEAFAAHVLSGARPADAAVVVEAARACAVAAQRGYVTPSDIREVAPEVLSDRVILSAQAEGDGVTVSGFINTLLDVVEVP